MLYLIILLIVMIPLVAIVLDSRLGQALAQRIEGTRLSSGDQVTHERIAFLEGEVERLNEELGRLSEESEFLHRLLTETSSASVDEAIEPASSDVERDG